MSNYKNLKKVIAISSMAAATIGAGTMVNADNVHQQSGSSQKSSVTAKSSSEAQSAKSGNTVVLKSSQSSKASSSAKNVVSSSKADSKKASSQNSKNSEVNVKSAVSALNDIANKYQNSSDATTQSYAQEAQQWISSVQAFMNERGWNSEHELNQEINYLKNDIKSNQDTLNASWFDGSNEAKQIMKDQINSDKAVLNYLAGLDSGAQAIINDNTSNSSSLTPTSSSQAKPSSKKDSSSSSYPDGGTTAGPAKISDKQAAELQWAHGIDPLTDQPLKNESLAQQQKAKAYFDALNAGKSVDEAKKEAIKSSNVKNSVKPLAKKAVAHKTVATVSSKKATKRTAVRSTKKASMPQTGEANNAGILAGIGALAIAAAGAFLFRKRG